MLARIWSVLALCAIVGSGDARHAVAAAGPPISLNATAFGAPSLKHKELGSGAQQWLANYGRGRKGERLQYVLIVAPGGLPQGRTITAAAVYPQFMAEALTTDAAESDVRIEGHGTVRLWNGSVEYVAANELAEQQPRLDLNDDSTKAARGPDRDHCITFVWYPDDNRAVLAGMYCEQRAGSEPPLSQQQAVSMLQKLGVSVAQ